MKLVAVTMVKNEEDIIERYIRINGKFIDTFLIADDNSTDTTLSILTKLNEEGFDIRVQQINDKEYRQNEIMDNLLRKAADYSDFIFTLDADEFIFSTREEIENQVRILKAISIPSYGLMKWVTYIPQKSLQSTDKLKDVFLPLENETYPEYKVVIPSEMAKVAHLSMGNHRVKNISNPIVLKILVGHFPVRSSEQITNKAITIANKYALKKDKAPFEGEHIIRIANIISMNNYVVPNGLLTLLAVTYLGVFYGNNERLNNFVEDKIRYPFTFEGP